MVRFFRAYPLVSVLLAALAARLLAGIWSQGFIHSDDHFDTIAVAWDWLQGGLWGDDGYLRWKHKLSDTIGRFPLYTLSLWAEMKLCQWLGMTSLSSMMYPIRFSHLLISLLPVWAVFTVVRQVTGSDRWAVIGGLMVGFHFAGPFLGARNLIEVVGGNIWIVAIALLYIYRRDPGARWLYLAGLATGLAWMIRFQIAFAVLPVPLILWWETKRLRVAVQYSVAVAGVILISGFIDWWLLGRFAGSSLTYLSMNAGYGALYSTIPFLYPVLFLLLLVPPFSFLVVYTAFRPAFLREHLILVTSTATFLAIHWLHPHQQERFILPMLPVFLLIAVLALWHYCRDSIKNPFAGVWLRRIIGVSIVINLVLVVAATFAYGHKGMIEPLKWFETNAPEARVMFVQPEIKRWVPIEYGGQSLSRTYLRRWGDLDRFTVDSVSPSAFDFFVIYPKHSDNLAGYLDSLQTRFGRLEPVFQVEPSYYDQTLHLLNRRHNDNFDAHIYRPVTRDPIRPTMKPGR